MTDRFRIALAQLNPVMGDIAGNLAKARAARAQASDRIYHVKDSRAARCAALPI